MIELLMFEVNVNNMTEEQRGGGGEEDGTSLGLGF